MSRPTKPTSGNRCRTPRRVSSWRLAGTAALREPGHEHQRPVEVVADPDHASRARDLARAVLERRSRLPVDVAGRRGRGELRQARRPAWRPTRAPFREALTPGKDRPPPGTARRPRSNRRAARRAGLGSAPRSRSRSLPAAAGRYPAAPRPTTEPHRRAPAPADPRPGATAKSQRRGRRHAERDAVLGDQQRRGQHQRERDQLERQAGDAGHRRSRAAPLKSLARSARKPAAEHDHGTAASARAALHARASASAGARPERASVGVPREQQRAERAPDRDQDCPQARPRVGFSGI